MEKLTTAEIKILEERVKGGKISQKILLALIAGAGVLLMISSYLEWESPASFFIGFFGFGFLFVLIIVYFSDRNVATDLALGMKTSTEGIVTKMEMRVNNAEYNYSKESLLELAEYMERKARGEKTDYGIKELQLKEGARCFFQVRLGTGWYDVPIRDYLQLEVGNNIRIIHTPKSGTVLSVVKL